MADEQSTVAEPVVTLPEPQAQPEPSQVNPAQPVQETQSAPAVAEPQVAPPATPERVWKIKHGEEEIEVRDEAELLSLASKGVDYQKRVQAFTEAEKSRGAQDQIAGAVLNNPQLQKALIASQMGYSPAVVMTEPQNPPEAMLQYDPQSYYKQLAEADMQRQQKQYVDNAFNELSTRTRETVNTSVLESARIRHDLNDKQYGEVQQFVQSNMRPSSAGTFSPSQVDFAVKALYGEQKEAQSRLAQTRQIQDTVKRAGSSAPATPAQRPQEQAPDVAKAVAYKEFVKSMA